MRDERRRSEPGSDGGDGGGEERDWVREGRLRHWVAALRSGCFAQGNQLLHSAANQFCCLGVACKVAVEDGLELNVALSESTDSYIYKATGDPGDYSKIYLLNVVQDWYGITGNNPTLKIPPVTLERWMSRHDHTGPHALPDSTTAKADDLNDSHGFNFDEIADCIEYTYLRADWEERNG